MSLQNKVRQLTKSARVADWLRSAAYGTSSRPLHSSPAQPAAYAANKEVFEHIPNRSEPILPGWLASLATFGVAAGVYATNTEQVPLTGRKQLLFNWCQPKATAHNSSSLAREAIKVNSNQYEVELGELGDKGSSSESVSQYTICADKGVQLVQSLYQQAALGTQTLALNHPDLVNDLVNAEFSR